MLDVNIEGAKSGFFDREKVVKAVDRKTRNVLAKFGAYVRIAAKHSIRPVSKAKLRKMGELRRAASQTRSPVKRRRLQQELEQLRRETASAPGEPPKSITGLLRNHIYFVYEPVEKSVIIGPARLNTPSPAPGVLEHGGTVNFRGRVVTIEPRPYMQPALVRELPKLPAMWKEQELK